MRLRLLKNSISVVLASSMLLSLCACDQRKETVIAPMEIEEVHAVGFDLLGGKDVMPISGYYGPYTNENSIDGISAPNFVSEDIYELISECGVNMINYAQTSYDAAPDLVFEMLKLGEKYNVALSVYDPLISHATGESMLTLKELDERISEYCDYPAFAGVYVVDEPGTTYFLPELKESVGYISDFAPIFQNLKRLGINAGGNLNPVHDNKNRSVYGQYIEEYLSTCEPPYLSFDFYVHDEDRTREAYFYHLDTIRHYADQYDIPFWCYIQAGGQWNDSLAHFDSGELYPTEGELHWNVNTALACGAKGINYFPLIQPYYFAYAQSKDFDFQRNGLLGAWGNRTQWWYYAKNINEQIAAVDSVLMNSVNKGIIVNGKQVTEDTSGKEFVIEGTTWRELESVEGNVLIGCFNYQGRTALYVVNYETEYAQRVTLNLFDSYNLSVIQNAEASRINTNKVTLDMKAGEGVLVVFD